MNYNVANFLWVRGQLSFYEKKCIESFVVNKFDVHVFSYDFIDIPAGAKLRDAREIIDESEIGKYNQNGQKGSLAAFSDVFRYKIIENQLGWWFDADVFCLKHVDEWVKLASVKDTVLGWESDENINGAVIFSTDNNFSKLINQRVKLAGHNFSWGHIGPKLITDVVKDLNFFDNICKRECFYPVCYDEFDDMFLSSSRGALVDRINNSYSVHIWNEFFSKLSIPKNIAPPKGSFLYWLFSKYSNNDLETALPENTFIALSAARIYPYLKSYHEKIENLNLIKLYRIFQNLLTRFTQWRLKIK